MRATLMLIIATMVAGCSTAGHLGRAGPKTGLQVNCGGGCLVYKADGSGCAVFTKETGEACSAYFDAACKSAPATCKNPPASQ
jgi:hypothetical protein